MSRRGRTSRPAGRAFGRRGRRPNPETEPAPPAPDRGHHTLEVVSGTVVGVHGGEVFVELGVRMQGVLAERAFPAAPEVGATFDFTLRGQEDGLWALSLVEEPSLPSWESLQEGSLVPFHVLRRRYGGLEGKVGGLHAFLPRSHTGKQREHELDSLVGRVLTCEVLEVDAARQRAVVSYRVARKRARESERQREASGLRPGQVVQGRVTRIEPYGVFLRFGAGLEGLIHVSNLSHERVQDVASVVQMGQALEAKVLQVQRGGRRISLGVKQVGESPWRDFGRRIARGEDPDGAVGEIVEGVVTRTVEFGAFVRVSPGVEGLLPRSEMGLPREGQIDHVAAAGQLLSLRVVDFDPARERLSLSLLHADGARIDPSEAQGRLDLAALAKELGAEPPGSALGKLLRRALAAPRKGAPGSPGS